MNVTINEQALVEFKKKLTPINAGKAIFGTLISIGATAAVIAAFRNPLKASSGILKLLMAAGIFVLACKAGDTADNYFRDTVDDWSKTAKEISDEMKKQENEQTKGADNKNGSDTLHRGNTQQQPEKQGTGSAETGQTSSPPVRRRWWSKKEGNAEVLEVDEKDVSERSESS